MARLLLLRISLGWSIRSACSSFSPAWFRQPIGYSNDRALTWADPGGPLFCCSRIWETLIDWVDLACCG
jgi:hypothetical protein